jgi:hypothetical protein
VAIRSTHSLTPTLDGADCVNFTHNPGERDHDDRWIGGMVVLRDGLDAVAKRKFLFLMEFEPRSHMPFPVTLLTKLSRLMMMMMMMVIVLNIFESS